MRATFIEEPAGDRSSAPDRPPASPGIQAFLDELLAEQHALQTPVARFSNEHGRPRTAHGDIYRDLIPLTAPRPGQQYAFEVDLDACSGCKACVAACHSLNGLDEDESWRDVGLVTGKSDGWPFQQTVTTACHHCVDPGCLNGCPVLAYEKDPSTGIVRHLDDQCIGCSYCILKCPYDVPKYNRRLGIVRKCDMCHGRLAEGEAPACAQACPTNAIRIVTVPVRTAGAGAVPRFDTSQFLPVAPDPSHTLPTTRYLTRRKFPAAARAADAGRLVVQHGHPALVLLLVLTQVAVGLAVAAHVVNPLLAESLFGMVQAAKPADLPSLMLLAACASAAGGLAASVAHLGQPLRAWRIFLGLRRSWLSREAIALSAFFALLTVNLALRHPTLNGAVVASGLLAVYCSVMIYVDTRRRHWRFAASAVRMFGTVAVAALAPVVPIAAAAVLAAKLAFEIAGLRGESSPARLQRGPLRPHTTARFALGAVAAILFSFEFVLPALVLWLVGELFERTLYFRAVDAPKMPGGTTP